MKYKCVKDGYGGEGWWTRDIEFPFTPFPGLTVGSHTVKDVLVCQGDLDGSGDIEVHLDPAVEGETGILQYQGWEFHG